MKTYKCIAIKTSPVPQHVHAIMFIKGEMYAVTKNSDPEWATVNGKFGNSLGGFERKEQSIQTSICREYLAYS